MIEPQQRFRFGARVLALVVIVCIALVLLWIFGIVPFV